MTHPDSLSARDEAIRQFNEERTEVNRRMLVTYRCKSKRCSRLLLAVWATPDKHRLYRTASYVLAPHVNRAESNPEGRRNNSVDGDNHWPEGGGDLDELAGPQWTTGDWAVGLTLRCNHVRLFIPATDLVNEANRASATRRISHDI